MGSFSCSHSCITPWCTSAPLPRRLTSPLTGAAHLSGCHTRHGASSNHHSRRALIQCETSHRLLCFFAHVGSSLVAQTGKGLLDGSALMSPTDAPLTLLLGRSRGVRVESEVNKQIIALSYKCVTAIILMSPVVLFIILFQSLGIVK